MKFEKVKVDAKKEQPEKKIDLQEALKKHGVAKPSATSALSKIKKAMQ